jgi:hypothetical protein
MLKIWMSLLFLIAITAQADWKTKNTFSKKGNIVELVCVGEGPSLRSARQDSLNSCDMNAARYLGGSIEVESTSIETLKQSFHHNLVKEHKVVTDLECLPQKEDIQESKGAYKVWVKCKYDLKKVTVKARPSPKKTTKKKEAIDPYAHRKFGGESLDDRKIIQLITIPNCSKLSVEGERSRVIVCENHPVSLTLYNSDRKIHIDSPGHIPKTIDLAEDIDFANTIFLERQ